MKSEIHNSIKILEKLNDYIGSYLNNYVKKYPRSSAPTINNKIERDIRGLRKKLISMDYVLAVEEKRDFQYKQKIVKQLKDRERKKRNEPNNNP